MREELLGGEAEAAAVQIDLRIPGPWRSPEELYKSLERSGCAYAIEEAAFVHRATGKRLSSGVSPHDDEIHEIFGHEGRLSKQEIDRIASHAVKVHVSGPGGSPAAAREVMDAATALVRAGGYGVMVDNSGAAHGAEDWLALAGDEQPGGLYWAYVTAGGDRRAVWSVGMHCLGFRDAEVHGAPDAQAAAWVLHNFLGYLYQSGATVNDGDALGDEIGPMLRAHAKPCTRWAKGTAFHNPYGIWRLEPAGEE